MTSLESKILIFYLRDKLLYGLFALMGRIAVLTDQVASQVAAGEVVERPASVVKELVENALDAGASQIEVLIQRGGLSQLRVIDNGQGMDRQDALLAVERHATSKIRDSRDLAGVTTMGFRGEALASIASVSQFSLSTREANSEAGTVVRVDGGRLRQVEEVGLAPGTQIEVRHLFFNVPARRKFLKSQATEAARVERALRLLALAHPEVAFRFQKDSQEVFRWAAGNTLRERVFDFVGKDLQEFLLPLAPTESKGLQVEGWLGQPGYGRGDRRLQCTFLNGRVVESALLQRAIRSAYEGRLPPGKSAMAFLWLRLAPERIDVNVHPAKKEVRFRDELQVEQGVREVLVRALQPSAAPAAKLAQTVREEPAASACVQETAVEGRVREEAPSEAREEWTFSPRERAWELPLEIAEEQAFQCLAVLGGEYGLLESTEGLVLLRPRAAKERIFYERALEEINSGEVARQALLVPVTLQPAPSDLEKLLEHRELLSAMGFALEFFGSGTLKLDEVPAYLEELGPAETVLEMAGVLKKGLGRGGERRQERLLKAISQNLSQEKAAWTTKRLEELVAQLLRCDMPYCCPRGRPTLIQFSWQDLKKRFQLDA
ncbi:MAG: DNA mismatch repair endonuclease MutL [Verrucomicrobiota bacterium]